jgi:hypothetical protein
MDGQQTLRGEPQRRHALRLRRLGMTYLQIAEQCGYSSAPAAYRGVTRALKATYREAAYEVLALELDRLDRLQVRVWEKAINGDLRATDRMLAIIDRRANLLGLYRPKKVKADLTTKGKPVGGQEWPSKEQLARLTSEELDLLYELLDRVAERTSAPGVAASAAQS